MRVQCDVCANEVASAFCCADEAALCATCDVRVHTANKLAAKHPRFSLVHPISSDALAPRCDVCQEKKALLFCQQDRAILCGDCDSSIHSVNEFTMKHTRFLLAGLKISSIATPMEISPSSSVVVDVTQITEKKKIKKVSCELTDLIGNGNGDKVSGIDGRGDFCENLINTLPRWKIDNLLLDYLTATTAGAGSCSSVLPTAHTTDADLGQMGFDQGKEKNIDMVSFPFMGHDEFHLDSNGFNSFEAPPRLISQVPQFPVQSSTTTVNFHRSAEMEKQRWDWVGGCDEFGTVPHIAYF